MNYAFEFNGVQFTPSGRTSLTRLQAEQHNADLDAACLRKWSAKPEHFYAYVIGDQVQTWTGKILGRVVSSRPMRHARTNSMLHIRIRGNNGADYYGRYGSDNTQCVRMHKLTKGART